MCDQICKKKSILLGVYQILNISNLIISNNILLLEKFIPLKMDIDLLKTHPEFTTNQHLDNNNNFLKK